MNTVYTEAQKTQRLYYFDWLRTLAFVFVVLIHCIEVFHDLYQPRNAPGLQNDALTAFLPVLTQWCMALYFLLAGASTWFALKRKSPIEFVRERFSRLFMPLALGFVLLFPLQAYVTMISNNSYQGSLFAFYPYFFGEILLRGKLYLIILHIHHLWFLAYLFGFSLLTLPLCLLLRSARWQVWMAHLSNCPGGLLMPVFPLLLTRLALLPAFPEYCSLADASCWLLIYIYGYVLFANSTIQQVLRQQGRQALILSILCSSTLLALWCMGLLRGELLIPRYTLNSMLYQATQCLALWSSLIVLLTLGSTYMNRTCPLLTYSSSASFHWYLLHFPIVMISAYYILCLPLPAWCALSLIGASSFLATFLLADLVPLHRQGLRRYIAL
ncbi:acyltransferase family protein [Ktedonospora formicarum]|uniref:Membrane protein n=1 Tax=Ktedonospora formicarum TaxID=2778364 RepID=A0A8J3IE82_9CHLR|nr:acyltransferase [Ktedonospora formicarum]GHO51127.1 membrane protein [Ktedonospora formicarum]